MEGWLTISSISYGSAVNASLLQRKEVDLFEREFDSTFKLGRDSPPNLNVEGMADLLRDVGMPLPGGYLPSKDDPSLEEMWGKIQSSIRKEGSQ